MAEEDDEHIYMKVMEFCGLMDESTNYNATAPRTSFSRPTSVSNRPQKKRFGSKAFKVTRASSTQLSQTITLDMRAQHNLTVSFLPEDKLVIMFRYRENYVVYRKSDCAIAVLRNPAFKKPNPPIMLDGDKMGAILHNVQMVIMYAVATTDFQDTEGGMQFCTFDLILVLAKCRGVYLGITAENRVGVFPPDKVVFITKPRLCLFPGMTLKVEASANLEARRQEYLSVRRFEVHTITKGKKNLFDWCTPFERRKVPLHVFRECVIPSNVQTPPPLPAGRHRSRNDLAQNMRTSVSSEKEGDVRFHGEDYNEAPSSTDNVHEASSANPDFSQDYSRTGSQKSTFFDTIPDNDERLYAVYERSDDLTEKKMKECKILLQQLLPHREVVINDDLRAIVADSVDEDVLHDLGERIKVSRNRLRDIDNEKETIYDKTYDLLGIWHQKFGNDANVGFLLDALVEVNPEDLKLILEDILRSLQSVSTRDPSSYYKIQRKGSYVLPQKAKQERVNILLDSLRRFRDVEINEEIRHIVSQYVDDDVWHELGQILEISKNTRTQIEKHKKDILGKTYDLLGQWHQKFGSEATLGILLDALVSVEPEDLYLILKDLSQELDTSGYTYVR